MPSLSNDFLHALRQCLGAENLLTGESECWNYGYDNSRRHSLPQAVAFATRHEQVLEIVRLCNQYQVALTARGRGTGTTGASVPLHAGLVLSLERMNRILRIDPDNRLIIVEPGVTNQAVQDAAAAHGFFWPPDPTSAAFCSIGGNLAYNSAGPRAVKYGTPRENTLGLRAVTGAGEELRTGTLTTKGVVGYDLTRLLIGSEGTLAIITEAALKLTPLPETKRTLRAIYVDIQTASRAVAAIMAQPITPCALEFIDHAALDMIRDYSDADLPQQAGALLMIEVDGSTASIDDAVESVRNAASNDGLLDFMVAQGKEEIAALWATRKALSPALRKIAPKKINEDVVVPVSRIPELISGLEKLAAQHAIKIVNFGHAGNGNIHVNLLVNPDDPAEMQAAQACLDDVFSLVLKLEGSLSGEHGVGIEKRDFIARELDPIALQLMQAIRRQFDPNGILNADKTLPATS
ncbi:FAD-binding oxidoreductase [Sulfuriflexus mobilis]|uniref:FAD-binding oxidoreductase n=1 Tax=Sulfuriflexus mobilis TaxID=1811807 RepID=UPI000F83B858|nr:FAD-linked oxidase C-terminal domain-containing protein [Sulfuriflexus mobilis]